ncbi:PilW family protein [Schnuerera sp.]|uniref:PilW family protein n=1 Tax=Schnuerera sp. TaxID=2794844 RepID=UPI002CF01D06|nr:prepilin-type N-terminal cleavage/methylation domain-containing protein [Schnuerera sp.]HSH36402.1 prepilin-type N-terminal cleavage/methylation domain-containing protein [Schnuerera sp.]
MKLKREGGFTLIELILALAINSILFLAIFSMLNFSVRCCKLGDIEDEVLLNGRYALEYIKREIRSADKIISTEKFDSLDEEYEDHFGFVIMNYDSNKTFKYNYITYYFKNNKIYRIAANRVNDKLPKGSEFSGHNEIAEFIESVEGTNINFNTKLIELIFILEGKDLKEIKLQSKLSVRCPTIY